MNHLFHLRQAHRSKLWVGLSVVSMALVMFVSNPVWADDALGVKTLKEQAKFWESKGRMDLAVSAWKRLLQLDPRNSEALAGIAQFEVENNRPDAARAITDELKKQQKPIVMPSGELKMRLLRNHSMPSNLIRPVLLPALAK